MYSFGSIYPVEPIHGNMAMQGPFSFQGKIADKELLPKKAQIPFITNQSTCTFIDTMAVYIYNLSDDTWYNSADPSDTV